MKFRGLLIWLLVTLLSASAARAGESGLNVIVVVNQNSTNSVELGNDYCELRGVPPQNLLRLTGWTGGSINWTPAQFASYLLNPLLSFIRTRGLTNQAEVVLLSMDIPYRVTDGYNENSTTSALFYGFKTNGAPVAGFASCSLPDVSSNSYAYSELPFRQAPPNTATNTAFLAMMLTDTNLAAVERILRRAVAADHTYPTQAVYLEQTSDTDRNVRFLEADNSVFENQIVGNDAVTRIYSDYTTAINVFGFQTGLQNLTLATNSFVTGALADNLTSFGGYILEYSGQTPLLAFVEAGAAASYGTVVEPCNYLQKFPDPEDYFYQTRGFSLAEAYYLSVLNPFQGLMVGEPLCAPFARPGTGVWNAPTNNAMLSGLVPLSLTFTSAATNLPLAQADLFVDGTFFATMTNVPPTPGNVLSVILNGDPVNYTIQTTDTLASAMTSLADELNLQTNETQVVAYPLGDRIELQSQAIYVPGSNVTVSASAGPGLAASSTTLLTAARPAFLDTVATGYHYLLIQNTPAIGDWLQLTFIKTNGVVVTLGVTNNTAGAQLDAMVNNLINQIKSTPVLESPDGLTVSNYIDYGSQVQLFLYPRTPGCAAAQILATLDISSTNIVQGQPGTYPLADNLSDLIPRNHLYFASGLNTLPVNYTLDTTRLADGWHQLIAVSYEGTSIRTQTRLVENVLVQNTSLAATFASLPTGTNVSLAQPLQFTVTPNAPNIASINLFSTGGSIGVVTNRAAATFTLTATNLGLGLHPFYALVTDTSGHQYQTQTLWYRIFPTITLTLTGPPLVLTWPATLGYQYNVQAATNLLAGFQTVATLTATNTLVQWPITNNTGAEFYRVQLNQ
jgi:uncharacterized protein (TIGR03790 family)